MERIFIVFCLCFLLNNAFHKACEERSREVLTIIRRENAIFVARNKENMAKRGEIRNNVSYRVNSIRATQFHQWATGVPKMSEYANGAAQFFDALIGVRFLTREQFRDIADYVLAQKERH